MHNSRIPPEIIYKRIVTDLKFKIIGACAMIMFFPPHLFSEELLAVTFLWPPYVSEIEGEISGMDVEVAEKTFERMGYTISVKNLPWKRCLKTIENRKADIIISAGKNKAREKYLIYPKEYLSTCDWTLFYRKGREFKYNGINSIRGKAVGVVLGYYYGKEFNRSQSFVKDSVPDSSQNIRKLLAGRIDFFIENKHSGLILAKSMGVAKKIQYINKPVSTSGLLYVAFSRIEKYQSLSEDFSEELKLFKKSEEYKNIVMKYDSLEKS